MSIDDRAAKRSRGPSADPDPLLTLFLKKDTKGIDSYLSSLKRETEERRYAIVDYVNENFAADDTHTKSRSALFILQDLNHVFSDRKSTGLYEYLMESSERIVELENLPLRELESLRDRVCGDASVKDDVQDLRILLETVIDHIRSSKNSKTVPVSSESKGSESLKSRCAVMLSSKGKCARVLMQVKNDMKFRESLARDEDCCRYLRMSLQRVESLWKDELAQELRSLIAVSSVSTRQKEVQ
eukprot:ANDGO_07873.mRNA.1 hypothetical protein